MYKGLLLIWLEKAHLSSINLPKIANFSLYVYFLGTMQGGWCGKQFIVLIRFFKGNTVN